MAEFMIVVKCNVTGKRLAYGHVRNKKDEKIASES